MTRGELADRAGVNTETIRYYEQRGVLPKASRTAAGYRIYSEEDVDRLRSQADSRGPVAARHGMRGRAGG